MKIQLGTLFVTSAVLIGPAAAQDAASLLQAADKAMGASAVKSVAYSGAGTMRYPGQNYEPNGDWPRAPMTSYSAAIDYGSNSAKEEYAVDVAKKERGGGLAAHRIKGAQREKAVPAQRDVEDRSGTERDRKSTRLNSSHRSLSRMPSSA